MERINNKLVWSNKSKIAATLVVLSALLVSVALPAYANGQSAVQQSPQYGYPFSVLNSSLSEGTNGNSYQIKIGMDDAQSLSLVHFNLNLTSPFYNTSSFSSEQISKTSVQATSYFELSYPISIFNNASTGNYTLSLYIQYWTSFPYGNSHPSGQQTLNITVAFLGTTSPEITTPSTIITAGETSNLIFAVHNNGTGRITDLKVTATYPSSVTLMNSLPTMVSLAPGSFYNFTEPVFVSSGTSGVISIDFTMTFDNPYGTQSSVSNETTLSVQPLVSSINVTASTDLLTSGQTNNVSFTFTNNGNSYLSNVETSVSSQSQLSFLKQFPAIDSLRIDGSFTWLEPLYVSSSVSGAVTISFSETFTTPSGTQSTTQSNVGLYTRQSSNSENVSLQVKMASPYVMLGINSSAVLDITNIGNSTLHSPVVMIAAPSGFTVTGNSTFYYPNATLPSGSGITVPILLSSSPSTTQGAYTVSVSIDYYNSTGTVLSKTFSAGFLALAKVSLIVQGFSENTSGSSITVSGTLLDEGVGSAYYLTLNATFVQQNTSSSDTTYIGEVDSNTPTPFSLTFGIPAGIKNGTSTVSVKVFYQNYYGEPVNTTLLSHSIDYRISLNHTNQTTTPPNHNNAFRSGAILIATIIVVIVLVVGLVLVTRKRRDKKGKIKQ